MLFNALIILAGGILAASPFIISKKPNAKELIDKMVPYQGWIGVVLFLWGISVTLGSLGSFSVGPIYGVVSVVGGISMLLVGFLLGFSLISKYALSKNEAAKKKGDELLQKIIKFQIPLGFITIAVGVIYLLYALQILRVY